MRSTKPCVATADTHAASLTKTDPVDSQATGGASADPGTTAIWSANLGVAETDIVTAAAIVVASSPNFVFVCGHVAGQKITNAGTITLRIKEGAATLFSFVSVSISAGSTYNFRVSGVITNETAASHTYKVSSQASTTGQQVLVGVMYTMAAYPSLTGAPGSCI